MTVSLPAIQHFRIHSAVSRMPFSKVKVGAHSNVRAASAESSTIFGTSTGRPLRCRTNALRFKTRSRVSIREARLVPIPLPALKKTPLQVKTRLSPRGGRGLARGKNHGRCFHHPIYRALHRAAYGNKIPGLLLETRADFVRARRDLQRVCRRKTDHADVDKGASILQWRAW